MKASGSRAWYRRWTWKRMLLGSCLSLLILFGCLAGYVHWKLRSSLPMLSGTIAVKDITQNVSIDRDSLGIPTIQAASRSDAAFALGFLHAQDRFFQMDCLRRLSSGRLSELFGEAAVGSDNRFRKHRFGSTADDVVNKLPVKYRTMLDAYTSGVNSGIEQLQAPPFEYLMLGRKPAAWSPEDSIFVMLSMLCDLQPMDGTPELALGLLHEKVPAEVFDFLVPRGSQWDAALDDSMYPLVAIPGAEIWSVRDASKGRAPTAGIPRESLDHESQEIDAIKRSPPSAEFWAKHLLSQTALDQDFRVGSNNFAISSARGGGKAILGSDMHLGLRVPATWYRAVINAPTLEGTDRVLVGVTLPGTPLLIEGSNGSVAWGFTNSYGDYGDVIELKEVAGQPDHYMTPKGPKPLRKYKEVIALPGGVEFFCEYMWSDWGPVVAQRDGRRFVHRWIGHDSEAFNLRLMDFEETSTVEETLEVANEAGMPHVNVVAVDTAGNIGWTVCGRVPRRPGEAPMIPVDWSTTEQHWIGYLSADEYPRLINPSDGTIWTANNRIMGDEYMRLIGNGGYDRGARARQIRDRLRLKDTFDETELLQVQLDDEGLFLKRWQELLLKTISVTQSPVSKGFVEHVVAWEGRASTTSVGYRLTHEFRLQVINRIFGFEAGGREALGESASESGAFAQRTGIRELLPIQYEDASWALLVEQPEHWLAPKYSSWQALLEDAAAGTERKLSSEEPLAKATWGRRNLVTVNHPITGVVPILSRWLNMTPRELPGDNNMPRVQGPMEGASQRMVVAPGYEKEGLYHQPGGQSAHPYSPFYRAGFDDWCEGKATPLMPGDTIHTLHLEVMPAE